MKCMMQHRRFGLDAWDDEGGKAQLATQMEMFCTKGQRVQVTGRLKFERCD